MKLSVVLPILTPTPFLRAMTVFTIKTLRTHADNDFELIVVEAAGRHFDPAGPDGIRWQHNKEDRETMRIDKYLSFEQKIGAVKEFNAGVRSAAGEFIVSTGNDVIVPPHWDTELLRCFEERKDCGVAALSAFEPGAIIGPPQSVDMVVEGMYSPFMMWRAGRFVDEAYRKIYCDSDLIMQVYESGQRAYRSCRAHVHHLLRMTSDRVEQDKHSQDLAHDERLFYQRWGKSPLMMFGLIRSGQWTYGHEHESMTRAINLHYDPTKPA